MSALRSRKSIVLFVVAAVIAGCGAEGIFELGPAQDNLPTEPQEGGVMLPPSSPPTTEPDTGDSGVGPKDASSKDASKDATTPKPIDAGVPAPETGDSCNPLNKIHKRACGACGTQEAVCLVSDADAGTGTVSAYSACDNQLVNGCEPGTQLAESCGNCGTRTKTCPNSCVWQVPACTGEPPNSCPAGTIAWATTGCPTPGTFRQRTCSASCGWSGFTDPCTTADFALTLPSTIGETAKGVFPLTSASKSKRLTGTCGENASLSATDKHLVAYVRVSNPTGKTATVSAWNSIAPNGGAIIDTAMTIYPSVPTSDEELKQCAGRMSESCPTAALPCGDSKLAALTDQNAFSIAPGATVVVAFFSAQPFQTPGQITEGPVMLNVRTDALQ